ncbi:MAG: DNA-directed RNA polymerase subunit RpoH/Rpb5 C-terminal domain-containing protein [Candidatus Micrarchaeota archaeon]
MKKKTKKVASTLDVLSHMLVSKMEVLSDKDAKKLLAEFEINSNQLPSFSAKDPALLALGAVPGNIVKITRDDGTGKYQTYRIVK